MIPLNAPSLGPLEEQYVLEALRSGWTTTGKFVRKFEEDFSRYVGRKYAVACSSGTSALWLAIMACRIPDDKRVLTASYTCDAVASATINATGKPPLVVDVTAGDWSMSAAEMRIALATRPDIGLVTFTHCYGVPARDTEEIVAVCAERGIPCIEDASEAHGAAIGGRRVGSYGDVSIFSCRGEKAVAVDELLPTPTGYVKAGDVRVGDFLIASDGSQTVVEGVYPQPIQPLWRVRFLDGTSVVTTADHLWTVDDLRVRTKGQNSRRLLPTERLKQWHAVPLMARPAEFQAKRVLVDPYLLGVLLGDGCMTDGGSVTLTSADEEIVASVRSALDTVEADLIGYKNYTYQIGDQTMECRYRYSIRPRVRSMNVVLGSLRQMGLWGKKSHEKFVPSLYLWNSADARLAVLHGLMDTDGTAEKNGSVSFTTTSPQLADDVIFLVRSLGGIALLHHAQTYYTYRGERRTSRPSFNVSVIFPDSVQPFRLTRKLARIKPRQRYARRRVIAVEQVSEGASVCFRVAHPDHLFAVSPGFVLTHNTIGAGQMGVCLTDDKDLAERIHQYAHNGLPVPASLRYWSTAAGLNCQPAHLSAALACAQLERLDELVKARNDVHRRWRELLGDWVGRGVEFQVPVGEPAMWLTGLWYLPDFTYLTPQDFGAALRERGIETRPAFYSLHHLPHCRGTNLTPCTISTMLLNRLLILPSGPHITAEQQEHTVEQMFRIMGRARR